MAKQMNKIRALAKQGQPKKVKGFTVAPPTKDKFQRAAMRQADVTASGGCHTKHPQIA